MMIIASWIQRPGGQQLPASYPFVPIPRSETQGYHAGDVNIGSQTTHS
jgi:hypothetical protein